MGGEKEVWGWVINDWEFNKFRNLRVDLREYEISILQQ